jgi:hypothetical protein
LKKGGIIGNELQQRTAKAAKMWTEILERISATVQTLAQQNFFLRSHREYQSRKSYSMFDPLTREHWDPVFGKAWLCHTLLQTLKMKSRKN